MATHIQPMEIADAGIAGETAAPPPVRRRRLGSGIEVGEYAPTLVKKAVVGTGKAEKAQVHAMVSRLLPGARIAGPDAADALAVAITHAHHLASKRAGISH